MQFPQTKCLFPTPTDCIDMQTEVNAYMQATGISQVLLTKFACDVVRTIGARLLTKEHECRLASSLNIHRVFDTGLPGLNEHLKFEQVP